MSDRIPLNRVPADTPIFVDTTPLIYHLQGIHSGAKELMKRIERRELIGYTSLRILDELLFKAIIIEAIAKFGWTWKKVKDRLRANKDKVKELSYVYDQIAKIAELLVVIEPTFNDLMNCSNIQQQYGLFGNDAVVGWLMKKHRIQNLATFDSDFDNVKEIRLIEI